MTKDRVATSYGVARKVVRVRARIDVTLSLALVAFAALQAVADTPTPTPTPDPELVRLEIENARLEAKKKNAQLKKELAEAGVPDSPALRPVSSISATEVKMEPTLIANYACVLAAREIDAAVRAHWKEHRYWIPSQPGNYQVLIGETSAMSDWQNSLATKAAVERLLYLAAYFRQQVDELPKALGPIQYRVIPGDNESKDIFYKGFTFGGVAGAVAALQSADALASSAANIMALLTPQIEIKGAGVNGSSDVLVAALARELSTIRDGNSYRVTLASTVVPALGKAGSDASILQSQVRDISLNLKIAAKELDRLVGTNGIYVLEMVAIQHELKKLKAGDTAKRIALVERRKTLELAEPRISVLKAESEVLADQVKQIIGDSTTTKIVLADYQRGRQFGEVFDQGGFLITPSLVASGGNVKTSSSFFGGNKISFNGGAVASYRIIRADGTLENAGNNSIYIPYLKDVDLRATFPAKR